jgi:hypothetical protein
MGYRSQVVFAIAPEIMGKFMAVLAKHSDARVLCFEDADTTIKDYIDEGSRLMKWDDIKWYEGYPEIDALDEFMDWADSTEIEIDGVEQNADQFYRFVRIGEEMDDVTIRGDAYWDINVRREVCY